MTQPTTATGFRKIMGDYATGVVVVTFPPRSDPVGVTIDSFMSVSLNPPLVVIGVDQESSVDERLTEDDIDAFCVNILSRIQRDLAKHFAGTEQLERDPFEARPTLTGASDAPAFKRSLAYLDCRIRTRMPVGEKAIWIGRVIAGGRPNPSAGPLAFYRGAWSEVEPQLSTSPDDTTETEAKAKAKTETETETETDPD